MLRVRQTPLQTRSDYEEDPCDGGPSVLVLCITAMRVAQGLQIAAEPDPYQSWVIRVKFRALRLSDRLPVVVQAMIVLLTMLTRTSVVDATHVWEQLARQNASAP